MSTFKRKIYYALKEHLEKKEHTIVIGARQTGKTTLMRQLNKHLSEMGQKVYFLTLEDFTILSELNKHPDNIFKYIEKPENNKVYLLIDEIQYLDNPSNFLKLIFDKYAQKLKIIATGSSAFYIDTKFKDSLAGRKKIFELHTLDFEEYLQFKGDDGILIKELHLLRENSDFLSLKRNELMRHFNDYLIYGGYPAVVLNPNSEEKVEILKELFTSYLKKDALEAGIQYQGKFLDLLKILAHQTGSLLNTNEISNTLGLSNTAVNTYNSILEKGFHITTVKPFYNNIRKELTKMPKVYFNDLGFRNIIMNSFNDINDRIDKGIITENYIFIRLRQLYGTENINFWRTTDGLEIDFIYTLNNKKYALESKFNYKEFKEKTSKKFIESYPDIPIDCRAYISENNSNNILAL